MMKHTKRLAQIMESLEADFRDGVYKSAAEVMLAAQDILDEEIDEENHLAAEDADWADSMMLHEDTPCLDPESFMSYHG